MPVTLLYQNLIEYFIFIHDNFKGNYAAIVKKKEEKDTCRDHFKKCTEPFNAVCVLFLPLIFAKCGR